MKDTIDKHHNGTFQVETLEDGKPVKLSKHFPKNARLWSLKRIVEFCLQKQDNETDETVAERKKDLSRALSSFKSESIYSTWVNFLDGLRQENRLHPASMKAMLHHGAFHASERYELQNTSKK